ncbi:PREDICTED: C-type lectin lectoxin-Lio3-like, partial [Branchiostoma belcheri]|uniref:C-type lectin lectoxin-Lio3-like n=1 Tax=Branchiostoma belcheri TaxID=7741 RepID=A0A6P4XZP7_BRABE
MKPCVLLLAAFLLKVLVSSPGGQAQTTGCPDGYVYHQPSRLCYKAFNDRTTYIGAVARCSLDGGTLAMPRDTATNEFLIDLKNAVDVNGWFRFGLTYHKQEGVWVWDDNVPLGDFRAWGPGEPNNDGGDSEECAEYFPEFWFKKNTWNDGSCTEAGKFICQVSPSGRSPEGSSQQPTQPPTQPATQPTTTQGYTTEENLSSHHPVEVGSRPSRQVPADEKVGPGVLAGVAIATAVVGFFLGVGVSQLVQWCRSKPEGQSSRQAGLEG